MNVKLADGKELTLPTITAAVMGHPGTGKSHFLASFPKPLLVLATDPMAKMQPYMERGDVNPEIMTGGGGQMVRLVHSRTSGAPIIQIEGFYDTRPGSCAMQAFMLRADQVVDEVAAGKWASVVVDSWSGLEDIALSRRRSGPFAINNPDGRAVYAAAKDDCKSVLVTRLVHLPCNVGITFHITEKVIDDAGTMLYNVKCIGDMPSTIGQNVAERYRATVSHDGVTRQLHTRPDGRFHLCTLIDAPSPCENNFTSLFSNWIAKHAAMGAASASTNPTQETKEYSASKESVV